MTAASHARLTRLFTEALALTSTGRARLIAELRADDGALASELVSLLAADEVTDTALETGGLAAAIECDPGPPFRPPEIPGYRLTVALGRGGMGMVYAAEQRSPRRRVAIKVLHARSRRARFRFKAEADIMARLDHPGIARVLEAGFADGHAYLAMEYVDGVRLDRWTAPPGIAGKIDLVIALCDAVHHAHAGGVIHRDLKPSNVMVRPDGRVAVLDFGVARLAAEGRWARGSTRAGELVGTPRYMSPEQARLRPDEVDARSDVYTIGVMLYELLAGAMPYPLRGLALPAMMSAICNDPPVPLGDRDPALRGDLAAITAKALRKDPADRYGSAAALAEDLRRYRQGLGVSARTPGAIEQVRGFVRRRPQIALALGAAAVAAALAALFVTRMWSDTRSAEHAASLERSRSSAAGDELAVRTSQLVLRQARAALAVDPTAAVARLTELAPRDLDAAAAWAIADEALGDGVAHDVLHGHSNEVHWIEPVAGGDSFVTGAYDGRAIVWDAPGFRPRVVFQTYGRRIHAARPSPDATRIAVGSDDELHVVGRDGQVLAELAGHTGKVVHLAWSPDGSLLASSDDHGDVWLWPHGHAPGRRLQASGAVIASLEFAADGSALVAGDHGGALWLWDVAGGTERSARIAAGVIDTWTDGRRVAAVDAAGTVHRWHVAGDGLAPGSAIATGRATKRAVFAPDGAWVVLGSVSGVATRVEGDAVAVVATHATQVRCLAVSSDGARIATASDDGVIQVLDRTTGRHWLLRGHGQRIRHLAFARGALLSSDGEGVVRRWEPSAMPATVLDAAGPRLETLVASRDGRWLAAVDAAGGVHRWAVASGERLRLGHAAGRVTAIAIEDGVVVTGTAESTVTWWRDRPSTQRVAGIVRSIAVGRDQIAVATAAGPIAIYTLAGEPVVELAGNTGGTEAVAFAPDGAELASGGQDWLIRVWRRSGDGFAPTAVLHGPTGDTHFVAFAPGGDRLFAAGNDGAVLGWTDRDGAIDPRSQVVLARHVGIVSALAVSPDGKRVASSGRDDTVIEVTLATGAAESFAAGSAARALAFDDRDAVQAVTRSGAVVAGLARGPSAALPAGPAIVIDHGVRAAAVTPGHLAIATGGDVIVLSPLRHRTFDELRATLARATGATPAR